jgi:hypothetical protein
LLRIEGRELRVFVSHDDGGGIGRLRTGASQADAESAGNQYDPTAHVDAAHHAPSNFNSLSATSSLQSSRLSTQAVDDIEVAEQET